MEGRRYSMSDKKKPQEKKSPAWEKLYEMIQKTVGKGK